MTREEALDFFNMVKGKKIRWTLWNPDKFVIPKEFSDLIKGISDFTLEGIDEKGREICCRTARGFESYTDEYGHDWGRWEFYDRVSGERDDSACKCSSYNLLTFGHDKNCPYYKPLKKLRSGI